VSDALLEAMIRIAREAAVVVERVYRTPFQVDYKGPRDPVTEADRLANELICSRLAVEFPGVPIVAEESAPDTFEGFRTAAQIFFVDPVDGTNEFIERNDEFVVMIGFVDGPRATHGVILAPVPGVAWAGSTLTPAVEIDREGARSPLRVSSVETLASSRVVSSRSHRSARLERVLNELGVREIVARGSAGLKGAEVARGKAELYLAPHYAGKRWDACASDALVNSAGGRVTDAFGELIDYRAESLSNDRGLVATNARIHDAVIEQLARHRAATADA
jgi:3'(2'), 5'-bisphosphate nucleotidase